MLNHKLRHTCLITLIIAFLFATIEVAGAPVVLMGTYHKAWQSWLKEQNVSCETVTWGGDQAFPVDELDAGCKLLVLAYAKPMKPLTDAENAKIQVWLEAGGMLVLTSGTPRYLAQGKGDLSSLTWLGAECYGYGKLAATVRVPANPLVKHMTADILKSLPFQEKFALLAQPTTGVVLLGNDKYGLVTLNRVGKGYVLFLGTVPMLVKTEPARTAWRQLVSVYLKAALETDKDRVPLAEGLGAILSTREEANRVSRVFRINGQLRVPIIVAAKGQHTAAKTLSSILARITGATIPIKAIAPGAAELVIHVGATPFVQTHGLLPKDLHAHGYIMQMADDKNLVIAGARASATHFGVYDFLHRFGGYRWFAPGELGEVVPKREFIELPEKLAIREEPTLESYGIQALNGGNIYYSRAERQTLRHGHNLSRILPPAKYAGEPERFPMIDGKRFVPGSKLRNTWQPCLSHPDLPRITVDWAKSYFKSHPWMRGFSACVNDGGGDCQCPQCVALEKKYSNQYIPYYNAVSDLLEKELPGKLIDVYGYGAGGSGRAPKNIRVGSNVFVMVTAPFVKNAQVLKAWVAAGTKHIGIYQFLYGFRYMVPRHYPHLLGNKWKETFKQYGVRGAYLEAHISCWLYDGPRWYVLNRLAWDINEDIDDILTDYFSNFYAEAASPTRRFFDRLEAIHARKADPFDFIGDSGSRANLCEYTQDDVTFLDAALEEARSLARNESVVKRVALLSKMWSLSRLAVIAHLRIKQLDDLAIITPDDIAKALDISRDVCRVLEEKQTFTLTPWEEENLLVKRYTLQHFKSRIQQAPYVENAIDGAFHRIWLAYAKANKKVEARKLFTDLALNAGASRLGRLARTALYLADHPKSEDIAAGGGFETGRGVLPDGNQPTLIEKTRGPDGWRTWHFQQSVTRFYWDGREAHSGKRSVAMGLNQIMGCFRQDIPVKSGERYRLTVWVKQNCAKGAVVRVRWSDSKGWRDEGVNRVPWVELILKPGQKGWQRLQASFSVPKGITSAAVLLKGPRQEEGDMTWFDDLVFERIYAPETSSKPRHGAR